MFEGKASYDAILAWIGWNATEFSTWYISSRLPEDAVDHSKRTQSTPGHSEAINKYSVCLKFHCSYILLSQFANSERDLMCFEMKLM